MSISLSSLPGELKANICKFIAADRTPSNRGTLLNLALACKSTKDEALRAIILGEKDHDRPRALQYALVHGDVELLQRLTAAGIDLSTISFTGYFDRAVRCSRYHEPECLDVEMWADEFVSIIMMRLVMQDLQHMGPPQVIQRFSPLHVAARRGHRKAVEYLLDVGVDINAESTDFCYCSFQVSSTDEITTTRGTPLHVAICHGQQDMAKYLLGRGASIYTSSNLPGHTAFHDAVAHNCYELVSYLISNYGGEIDVNAPFPPHSPFGYGNTPPLVVALGWLDINTVRLLLDHGASVGPAPFELMVGALLNRLAAVPPTFTIGVYDRPSCIADIATNLLELTQLLIAREPGLRLTVTRSAMVVFSDLLCFTANLPSLERNLVCIGPVEGLVEFFIDHDLSLLRAKGTTDPHLYLEKSILGLVGRRSDPVLRAYLKYLQDHELRITMDAVVQQLPVSFGNNWVRTQFSGNEEADEDMESEDEDEDEEEGILLSQAVDQFRANSNSNLFAMITYDGLLMIKTLILFRKYIPNPVGCWWDDERWWERLVDSINEKGIFGCDMEYSVLQDAVLSRHENPELPPASERSDDEDAGSDAGSNADIDADDDGNGDDDDEEEEEEKEKEKEEEEEEGSNEEGTWEISKLVA